MADMETLQLAAVIEFVVAVAVDAIAMHLNQLTHHHNKCHCN